MPHLNGFVFVVLNIPKYQAYFSEWIAVEFCVTFPPSTNLKTVLRKKNLQRWGANIKVLSLCYDKFDNADFISVLCSFEELSWFKQALNNPT